MTAGIHPPNLQCILKPIVNDTDKNICQTLLRPLDVHMQDIKTPLYGLSMYASESPEWAGTLPLGQSVHNYTMSIAGEHSEGNPEIHSSVYDTPLFSYIDHRNSPRYNILSPK